MAGKTREEIVAELKVQYPTLTRNVNGNTVELSPDEYSAMIDEWADNTIQIHNQHFRVQPEGFILNTSSNAEQEFAKLITLINLGLQQNVLNTSMSIDVWDIENIKHNVTIERFLSIMVAYGLFCYSKRGQTSI